MRQFTFAFFLAVLSSAAIAQAPAPAPAPAHAIVQANAWVAQSNAYTQRLLDVEFKHSPESGSHEGLTKFDEMISDPSLADEQAERKEFSAVLVDLKAQEPHETNKHVAEDLQILRKAFDLRFRQEDYDRAHVVPFVNASQDIFQGLRGLLDDQVAPARRPAALVRLRKYAGTEPGSKPFTELLKQRVLEQIAIKDAIYPSKDEITTELGRNANYIDGIAALFKKYKLTGWDKPFAQLKDQLAAYDTWVKSAILPKARTDFRMKPEQYALALEGYGIDIPPAKLAAMAHAAFTQIQGEMTPIAATVAKEKGYTSNDYRSVIAELKKKQITGEAILPFYKNRLGEIEKILVAKNLVSIPSRSAIIRLASAAETAQQPAPHMTAPPLLNNKGERGEFVLPLNVPSASGGAADKYDDFTFDAVAWTLTAHEARPGHELQFDSMVEHGVSTARALYAFNSTNVEGWGLYSEYIMQPFEPAEGQLLTLQQRLMRAGRAFLDPELQGGKLTQEQVYHIMEKDIGISHALATEEVERFSYRAPGQANSYFYGYTKLLELRKDTEAALGAKFDARKFHDFILAQGLLPPDLMHKAVMDELVPALLAGK
jgi:uncharacterized protein (DUF885 family)